MCHSLCACASAVGYVQPWHRNKALSWAARSALQTYRDFVNSAHDLNRAHLIGTPCRMLLLRSSRPPSLLPSLPRSLALSFPPSLSPSLSRSLHLSIPHSLPPSLSPTLTSHFPLHFSLAQSDHRRIHQPTNSTSICTRGEGCPARNCYVLAAADIN